MSTISTRTRITAAAIAVAAALTLTVAGCAAAPDPAAAAVQPAAVTVTAPAPAPVTVTKSVNVVPDSVGVALDAGDEIAARFHEVADIDSEFLQALSDNDTAGMDAANRKLEALVPKVQAAFADWDSASALARAGS